MPRGSGRRSEASDIELDGIAEQELIRLQQEYRIMEGDRKAYSEESQYVIRKQREAIAVLQAENEELMKENRLAGSQQNQTNDSKNIDSLSDMLTEESNIRKQVKNMKEAIAKLDQDIYQTEKKISHQRKNIGGVHMSLSKHVALQKQVRVLENRLDQGNKKFNQGLAENSKLRKDIDHMRTERTIFQQLYKKLEKRLHDNKEEIAKVIESSTSSYDSRDDAQNKMIALKEKSDKELLQYNMELKELMRIIDHDRRLKEFMNIKTEDRVELQGLSLQYNQRRGEERDKGGEKEDTIQSYETAFEQIKEATEIDDLRLLVGKFIETEDKNFALFNYVNELNNDIELLQEHITDIEKDIEQFKVETTNMDVKRQKILSEIEVKHTDGDQVVDKHQNNLDAANKILSQLKQGVDSLFNKINCDSTGIVDMLGGHAGVNDVNLMQYLGITEQRTNELIQVQAFLSSKNEGDDTDDQEVEQIGLLGKGPLPTPSVIQVQPPGTADDYDSDFSLQSDDDNRPMTQAELRERIVRGITKKESNSKRDKERLSSPVGERSSGDKSLSRRGSKKSPLKDK